MRRKKEGKLVFSLTEKQKVTFTYKEASLLILKTYR